MFDLAKSQLDELRSLLQGQILTAHNNLQMLLYSFSDFSLNIDAFAIIEIQTYQNKVSSELSQLKQLAETANVDVSSCTLGKEQSLNDLLNQKLGIMRSCISAISIQASQIIVNSKYIVDVLYNKVDALEFQLNQCSSEVCLQPIIQTIIIDNVELPQKIEVEVNTATSLFDPLKTQTHECRSSEEAQYVASADIMLEEIKECINDLLSK